MVTFDVHKAIQKVFVGCPELVAMLEETDKAERKQLMPNPQIAMIMQIGVASVGVSEEEYLDRVVTFLRNPPEEFLNKIQQWIEECTA